MLVRVVPPTVVVLDVSRRVRDGDSRQHESQYQCDHQYPSQNGITERFMDTMGI